MSVVDTPDQDKELIGYYRPCEACHFPLWTYDDGTAHLHKQCEEYADTAGQEGYLIGFNSQLRCSQP